MAKTELTRLQGGIAIASFCMGALISCVCLFFIEPLGEITSSGIIVVSNFLVLCGGILGVKASTDAKITQIETRHVNRMGNNENEPTKN